MTVALDAPVQTGASDAGVAQWELDADFTHYRVVLVNLGYRMGSAQDMFPPDTYVMAEPANMKRVWFPLDHPDRVAESYVMEKTACRGADARNLTTLLAAALGVEPIYLNEEGA